MGVGERLGGIGLQPHTGIIRTVYTPPPPPECRSKPVGGADVVGESHTEIDAERHTEMDTEADREMGREVGANSKMDSTMDTSSLLLPCILCHHTLGMISSFKIFVAGSANKGGVLIMYSIEQISFKKCTSSASASSAPTS